MPPVFNCNMLAYAHRRVHGLVWECAVWLTRGLVATRGLVDYWTVGMCVVSTYSRLMVMARFVLLAAQAIGLEG